MKTKRSPIPKLIFMALSAWFLGWLVIQHPLWFGGAGSGYYSFGVWAFGFAVGALITSIILKW